MKKCKWTCIALAVASVLLITGCTREPRVQGNHVQITNVSYDSTREFYEAYNEVFHQWYEKTTGKDVTITQSHGGSSGQARSIVEGNDADIVTLGSAQDVRLLERVELLETNWEEAFPNHSAPYTSTIVFLVRKGNAKHIEDWNDLKKDNISIIAPDPKSSSAACWIFLAAWQYGMSLGDGESGAKDFVRALYNNVKVLDSGARGSATTFVENKQGDVLLIWENEALQILQNFPNQYELITPSTSIVAEPTVAVVKGITERDHTTDVAKAYIEYLYSDVGQRLIGDYGFRPSNPKILDEFSDRFDNTMKLSTVHDLGGWQSVQRKFFDDGGVFDQIYGQ